jgi:hypothetical protein
MNNWPRDNTDAKNAFYGDFHSPEWGSKFLVRVMPPFHMFYEKAPMTKGILINEKCADSFMRAMGKIWDACGHDQAKVDKAGASDFGGCFNIRRIAGSNSYSNHSWACAVDLSPGSNGFNMKTTLSQVVISAFKAEGWRWGGDYRGRKDPMHFEAVSPA